MKLRSKIFFITDAKGEEIHVRRKVVAIYLNGKRIETKLNDIFSDLEFDSGEIYGNSLLSYYKVNEDGSLEVEGSKIQLVDADTNEPILVKSIQKPGINDDGEIPFEHVKKFAEFFEISKPEEVFNNLSEEEKQTFISERAAASQTITNDESKEDTAQIELEAQKQANAALKASINPNYVHNKSEYRSTQAFYAGLDHFKEYVNGKYHLFYGANSNYDLCVLIKHGEWWEEITEENTEIIDKTVNTVIVEFTGVNEKGKITLDIPYENINITDVEQY